MLSFSKAASDKVPAGAAEVASVIRANTPGDALDMDTPLKLVGPDGCFQGWSTTIGLFTFVKAVEVGNQAIIQFLAAECNVDIATVDQGGRNALQLAATCDILGAVTPLVRMHPSINHVDNDGCNALIYAAGKGHGEFVRSLTSATGNDGATIDLNVVSNDGSTALLFGASEGRVDIVQALLEAPGKDGHVVDLNAVSKDGSTALLIAADKGLAQVVRMLISAPRQGWRRCRPQLCELGLVDPAPPCCCQRPR